MAISRVDVETFHEISEIFDLVMVLEEKSRYQLQVSGMAKNSIAFSGSYSEMQIYTDQPQH